MNDELLAVIDQLRADVAAGKLRCFAGVGLAAGNGEWCEVIAVPPLEQGEVRTMAEGMLRLTGRMGTWSKSGESPVEVVKVTAPLLRDDDDEYEVCECEHDHGEDVGKPESWH